MFVLIILAFVAVSVGSAQEPAAERPKFEDYPVAEVFEGAPAPVVLDSTDKRWYKTRLTAGSKQKPNFAGHYAFVQWGCGSQCLAGAVVDLKTGTVLDPPYFHYFERWIICGHADRAEFRVNSRLVRITCGPEEPDEAYFASENGAIREIAHFSGSGRYRERINEAQRRR